MHANAVVYRAGQGGATGATDADPITTEVIRHGLNSAANQIKRALVRTSFSPIIYEVLDFAAVVYDRQFRLLAQAPSLPFFMGTMSFCIESAVEAVGGEDELAPGDIVLMNDPYRTGSHPQDAAMVMPVFLDDDTLIGYSAIKAHWMDIGAKEIYCTDTTDVFQEGVIFPGVKLYSKGELVRDIWRMATANSRLATFVEGDINAEVVGVRTGAADFVRLVQRFGLERFHESVERMYDHGEAVVRSYFEQIPDGRYVGRGEMDSDGITDDPIPFEVELEVDGSTCLLDFSSAPDARPGPVNCPLASTVSAARVVMTMLAGGGEAPNEGHFRPIEVATRPGSMFHALSPSPCFLYGWPAMQATEAVLNAVAEAVPERVMACSGRRPRRPRLVRVPRGHGRVLGRRLATPRRPGCQRARRRRFEPAAPDRGGDALLSDGGLGGEEPVADGEVRARARLGGPGQVPRRARAGHAFHVPGGGLLHLHHRAHEERALGARRRAARPAEQRCAPSS